MEYDAMIVGLTALPENGRKLTIYTEHGAVTINFSRTSWKTLKISNGDIEDAEYIARHPEEQVRAQQEMQDHALTGRNTHAECEFWLCPLKRSIASGELACRS